MIKRPRTGGQPRISRRPRDAGLLEPGGTGLLAGIVGHELNNISVPLQGFNDLAQETGGPSPALRQCLDEINIAVHRVRCLAAELESLGDMDTRLERVSIGACVALPTAAKRRRIIWTYPKTGLILVDRRHAGRAVESLDRAAMRGASRAVGPLLTVSCPANMAASCATCDIKLGRSKFVHVQTRDSCEVSREALRDAFNPTLALRATRRLTLAVLVHCAHQAGGHVLFDAGSGSLGVAFPTA